MKKLLSLLPLIYTIAIQSMSSKTTWKEEKVQRAKKALAHICTTRNTAELAQSSLKKIDIATAKLVSHLNSTEPKTDQSEKEFNEALRALMHHTQVYRFQSGNSLIPPLPLQLSELIPQKEINGFTVI